MLLLGFVRTFLHQVRRGLHTAFGNPAYDIRDLDYDDYWAARAPSEVQPRYPIIGRQIDDGSRVLDVGCGDGGMLQYLKEQRSDLRELGIDVSSEAVQRAKDRGVNASQTPLEEIAARDERFDYVIMSEVIEHVAEPEAYIRQAWRLTGRALLLSFPNIAYWPHRLRLLLGRFPVQWVHHPGEHLRFWSLKDFDPWLRRSALRETTGADRVEGLLFVASNGLTALRLHRLMPNLFANQIVVVVEKPEE